MARGLRGDRIIYNSRLEQFDEDDITGLFPEFGREVRRILKTGVEGEEIRPREAGRIAHLNHVTIGNMMKGDKPEYGTVQRFAIAFHADVNKLLELVGYLPIRLDANNVYQARQWLPEGYEIVFAPGKDSIDEELMDKINQIVSDYPPEMQGEFRTKYIRDAIENLDKAHLWERTQWERRGKNSDTLPGA